MIQVITIKEENNLSIEAISNLGNVYIGDEYRYICAWEDGVCVGILAYEIQDAILYIRYLFVKEQRRRQGVGSTLLETLQEYSKEAKVEGMMFSGIVPRRDQRIAIRFLMRYGFMVPEFGDQVATLYVKDWRNSYLASLPIKDDEVEEHICNMTSLTQELEYDYRNNIRSNVLPCCRIENVKGELIPEYSMAYDNHGKIGSYILLSDVEGELYLNSVYVYEKNAVYFIPLMRHCLLEQEKQGNPYDTMKVTLFSDESKRLFRKLTKGMRVENEDIITMCRM